MAEPQAIPHASEDAVIGTVEVDDEPSTDSDSTFGDALSETQSINSSILAHREENGRRYHAYKDGKYLGPNDEQESDRLDILHHIRLLQLGGNLHLAPLPKDFDGQILDLGAGTGIWAMDMGDSYPSATITGVDLSPTQSEWVPPNVYFEVDDIEESWTYSRKFDYIHSRFMVGSIRDWPNLMRQAYDNLKPGGWVEFCDWDYEPHRPDGSIDKRDNWIVKWHDLVIQTCAEKIGVHPNPAPELKPWAIAAGFEDVREVVFQVPVGGWAKDPKLKEIGRYYRYSLEEGLESITLRIFTQLLGYTVTEARSTNAMFKSAIKENNFYHQIYVVVGRKPLSS